MSEAAHSVGDSRRRDLGDGYGLERSARDRVPATTLRLEAFSEKHLQQRLIRDIALMGQKLEFIEHEIGQA